MLSIVWFGGNALSSEALAGTGCSHVSLLWLGQGGVGKRGGFVCCERNQEAVERR
jgi:hypothetical protein